MIQAMLIYNAGVVALVLFGGLGALGLPQWAAVIVHGAMGIMVQQFALSGEFAQRGVLPLKYRYSALAEWIPLPVGGLPARRV